MSKKEFQTVSIPVANHGLHRHSFNYPYVGSGRFMELFPVYYEPLLKEQSISLKGGFYSLLQPLSQSAFFTGRYHFKSVFVPYTFVFSPWYEFMQGTKYKKGDGTEVTVSQAPNVTHGLLSQVFCDVRNGFVEAAPNSNPGSYDIQYVYGANSASASYFKVTNKGARVLKVLNGLGIAPTWDANDDETLCLLNVLAYVKGFLDVYFPGQYVNSKYYDDISKCIHPESFNYQSVDEVKNILNSLGWCSTVFYDRSIFDFCWDTPTSPSSSADVYPKIKVSDQTYAQLPNWDPSNAPIIGNDGSGDQTSVAPGTGAFIGNAPIGNGENTFVGRITKFGLQALESIANFMKRNQLAGNRLIENFLAEHGYTLDNIDAKKCYALDDNYVEIQVSSVENNSNTNLGELAGKGVASTEQGRPMEFSCVAKHDGVFMVYCSIEPDSEMPVYNDAFNSRVFQNDFYHAAFDKLGVEGVRQISAVNFPLGQLNKVFRGKLFGFLNRYFGDIQEKPRLTGDFRLITRGAETLSAYHSLRTFSNDTVLTADGLYHSLDFINAANDLDQYQRIFYSSDQDNLLMYIRWFGEMKKHKLPMGDSYDWSDDEFNKRVQIVNEGMKH